MFLRFFFASYFLALPFISIAVEGDRFQSSRDSAIQFSLLHPKGWDCLNNKKDLPAKIEVAYIGKNEHGFTPSINLTTEETTLDQRDYVNLAKGYHDSQSDTRCQSLGNVDTESGPANLLQIDRKTQWGNIRFLQSLIIHDKIAYVITATCLQQDFPKLATTFYRIIKSLKIDKKAEA